MAAAGYAGPASDLAVIIAYHSPAGYVRPRLSLIYILSILERMDVPVTLVELAYRRQAHTFESAPYSCRGCSGARTVVKVRAESYALVRENLWNLGWRATDPSYSKLLFLDADVTLHETNWPARLSRYLEKADVVQPFRYAILRAPGDLNSGAAALVRSVAPSLAPTPVRIGASTMLPCCWKFTPKPPMK